MKLGIGASLVLSLVAAEARADEVQLVDRPDHVTEAHVIVNASPAQIYDVVTSYASWPSVFSDIRSVKVERGGREDAEVTFRSRALHDQQVTVKFANVPGRAVRFRGIKGPPGGSARGEYVMTPIDGGKRTRVDAMLYMDVSGLPSLFVRESTVRGMRRAKLHADLADLNAHFARR
ncbi:MAG TPA: SRPBCC family protein [Kofleriaceae bacterium]|nr:SRPBCC family protein [Kofleriaceae bacterium]